MRFVIFLLCTLLSACQLQNVSHISFPASTPRQENQYNAWQELGTGLEQRRYSVNRTIFYATRIDPNYFDFRVHYRPQAPLSIHEWQEELPNAALIINANFFDVDNTVLGLLVSDGVSFEETYRNRGGTFFVQDGNAGIRSNLVQPYQGEAFEQAIQAFPMLVIDGTPTYTNSSDVISARRTVIAQDIEGHIIILISSAIGISLYDLSEFLANSDMNIHNALNLDGGASSMSYIAATDSYVLSFDSVPAVLAAYAR